MGEIDGVADDMRSMNDAERRKIFNLGVAGRDKNGAQVENALRTSG